MKLNKIAEELHTGQGISELVLLCQRLKTQPDLAAQLETAVSSDTGLDKPLKYASALQPYLADCQFEFFAEELKDGKIAVLSPSYALVMQEAGFPVTLVNGRAFIDIGDFYI